MDVSPLAVTTSGAPAGPAMTETATITTTMASTSTCPYGQLISSGQDTVCTGLWSDLIAARGSLRNYSWLQVGGAQHIGSMQDLQGEGKGCASVLQRYVLALLSYQ